MKFLLEESRLLFVSFIVTMLLFTCFADANIDPESVVAIWLLDEGGGQIIEDSSENGHEGNIQGAVDWVDGKFGMAMEFSGATIVIPDHESFNFGEDKSFAVVLWFNFSTPQDWNRLIKERIEGPWGAGNHGWEIQTQGTEIDWTLDDTANNHQIASYPGMGDGEWHHTAMIVDRDEKIMKCYMDGAGEKTANIEFMGSVADTLNVEFGGGYAGLIDDVAIFKGILELDDVVEIMNIGLTEAVLEGSAVSSLDKIASTWGRMKNLN